MLFCKISQECFCTVMSHSILHFLKISVILLHKKKGGTSMEDPLQSWEAQLRTYALPEWDNLPELELYMVQVVLLLSR